MSERRLWVVECSHASWRGWRLHASSGLCVTKREASYELRELRDMDDDDSIAYRVVAYERAK